MSKEHIHSSNNVRLTKLYVVATPIGNLEDLTFRASKVLKAIEIVACEDTRHTRKLLSAIGSKAKTISCFMHKEHQCASQVISYLEQGIDVAFVSDAGAPAISDPGARLVATVREAGFKIIPIPGPSSITTALSVAGISADTFYFGGFLPAKGKERKKALQVLKAQECAIVLLESPHRILTTLKDLEDYLGNRKIFLAREMTKIYETYLYGYLSEIKREISQTKIRGEFTLVIEGAQKKEKVNQLSELDISKLAERMLQSGLSVKDSAALLSEITGKSKKSFYEIALNLSKNMEIKKNGQ